MSAKTRRPVEVFSLSFLDVISCGFGAVVLLLILALVLEPHNVAKLRDELSAESEEKRRERKALVNDATPVRVALAEQESALAAARQRANSLRQTIAQLKLSSAEATEIAASRTRAANALEVVRQTLSEETKRLMSRANTLPPPEHALIGGIPVDSEYIIFIVDTSGSMLRFAWPLVNQKVREVLEVYPSVKGIQVMNDMGKYMFSAYKGEWIPDTPARRKEVLRRLRKWRSFSNSSPVEGILAAVRQFYRKGSRISIYVFGDDFSGGNINNVLAEVAKINRRSQDTRPRVRVHAFGFPVNFLHPVGKRNRTRFAHLMRVLAEQNAGSFVGLNTLSIKK